MSMQTGKQSICFETPPYIVSSASIVGKKEGEGPLGACFDLIGEDDKFGQDTWEEAESTLQKEAFGMAVGKAGLKKEEIRYLFSGDLLGQNIATSFGLMDYQVPLFGLYGACSTCGEALSLGAMCVAAGYADYVVAMTSSHYGIKDSMNMGAAMAPAAADTICQNLKDFGRRPEDYDHIITGDLGSVGREILIDLLKKEGYDISEMHLDCGMLIYESKAQGTGAGGSGCGCSAVTLAGHFLKQVEQGKLQRILFVPTGALLSTVSFNEGKTVPGIAHGVVIEHAD